VPLVADSGRAARFKIGVLLKGAGHLVDALAHQS